MICFPGSVGFRNTVPAYAAGNGYENPGGNERRAKQQLDHQRSPPPSQVRSAS
ncbi:hypothetical protein ACUH92_04910 [Dermabacteraceae bacterium CCM 9520]